MAVVEGRFRVMASEAHVIVVAGTDDMQTHARWRLEQLERLWSRFLPDSDISRVNASAGRPVPVSAETVTLFQAMRAGWELTAGRFEPAVLPALVAAGYGTSIDGSGRRTVLAPGDRRAGSLDEIDIDAERRTITIPPGVAVDAGGIGKGLAADLTVAELIAAGAAGALVGIGGDLAMAGAPPTAGGWLVTVERPGGDDLCTLAVSAGGVATSSTRSRRWVVDGETRHHLIDPSTGTPSSTDLASVTVIAGSGWLAEVHATAALLAGSSEAMAYLRAHHLSGITIALDGETRTTADIELPMGSEGQR